MSSPVEQIEIVPIAGGVTLSVRVVPGASRTKVAGFFDRALRVAVAAPPEGGKANDELVGFLAKLLGVKRANVSLLRGHAQRAKVIAVSGIDAETARKRIATAIDGTGK